MCPTIWPMLHPASPSTTGGRQAAAAEGNAATSRSVRRRTLSKKRRYDAMSVTMSTPPVDPVSRHDGRSPKAHQLAAVPRSTIVGTPAAVSRPTVSC
jgi:hypothetical protein